MKLVIRIISVLLLSCFIILQPAFAQLSMPSQALRYYKLGQESEVRAIQLSLDGSEGLARDYYKKAVYYYSEALVFQKYITGADYIFFRRGDMYMALEYVDKAIADFSTALSINDNVATYYLARAGGYFKKGSYSSVLQDVDLAFWPKNTTLQPMQIQMARSLRGRSFYRLGDYKAALVDYNYVLRYDGPNAMTDEDMALERVFILSHLNQLESAHKEINRLIGYHTSEKIPRKEYLVIRADLLRKMQKYDLALKEYQYTVNAYPRYAIAYDGLGLTHMLIKKCDDAKKSWQKACSLGNKASCKRKC